MEQWALANKSGLFERGHRSSSRSLGMSVFNVLLSQFGAMRITKTLFYFAQQSGEDLHWREDLNQLELSPRNHQRIYCEGWRIPGFVQKHL